MDEPKHEYLFEFGVYHSPSSFVEKASRKMHPFDAETGLSRRQLQTIKWYLEVGPEEVRRSRELAVQEWRSVGEVVHSPPASPRIHKVVQNKNLELMKVLTTKAMCGDERLSDDIANGFNLVGLAKHTDAFPQAVVPQLVSEEELSRRAAWWSRALMAKVGPSGDRETDDFVWSESLAEAEKGWLLGPFSLEDAKAQFGEKLLVSRRFGLKQPGKIRLIDDMSESGVNSAYGCTNKASLGGIEEVLSIAKCLATPILAKEVTTFKADDGSFIDIAPHHSWVALWEEGVLRMHLRTLDLKSACKQLAVSDSSLWCSAVAVWNPKRSMGEVFIQSTLPFGASASVLHFNRASRALHQIGCALGGLNWSVFFDDFTLVEFSQTTCSALSTATGLMDELGWERAQEEKKNVPPASSCDVLGVTVDLSSALGGTILVKNKDKRVSAICEEIGRALKEGKWSESGAASLRGKLLFAESNALARWGRWHRASLSESLSMRARQFCLDESLKRTPASITQRLKTAQPRQLRINEPTAPILIFTDGAAEEGQASYGALMIDPSDPKSSEFFSGVVDANAMKKWKSEGSSHPVAHSEMLPLVSARLLWSDRLRHRKALMFVDNTSVVDAAIKGWSKVPFLRHALRMLCQEEACNPSLIWYARVPSISNPADAPSRGRDEVCWAEFGARKVDASDAVRRILHDD